MNEQPTKKIIFNKSILFNLKAELVKKQEEVIEKKKLPQHKIENFKPPPPKPSDDKPEKEYKKSFKDALQAVDTEELEACRKSKAALEKKAELYEHLADSAGESQLAGRFLVDFKTKKDEEARDASNQEEKEDVVEPVEDNDADEWTEFTDCLGRTRKCLKVDLEQFKERDKQLMKLMFPEKVEDADEEQEPQKEKPFLVQKTNDYLKSLRAKWEEKERELLAKDKDIHYQDLLFDEARMHGVGYYSFSTDEAERKKQMEELVKLREATLQAQKEAESVRTRREALLAERIKAAKARQRIRAGLPPEDPEEKQEEFTKHLLEFLTQQRNEVDAKAKEEEKQRKEEIEKERKKMREAYIREWDLGKDGLKDGEKKRFRELTQEEYVEQQRGKRIEEFAPLQAPGSSKSKLMFDERGNKVDAKPKTWSEVRPEAPPPPIIGDLNEQKGLYFSTKQNKAKPNKKSPFVADLSEQKNVNSSNEQNNGKNSKFNKKHATPLPPLKSIKEMKYKNFVKPQTPTPIVNELVDEPEDLDRGQSNYNYNSSDYNSSHYNSANYNSTDYNSLNNSGAQIAPPPTYDYYGPVAKKQKFSKPFDSDMSEAYAQGTKSLESKATERQLSKDYDFMFD